MKLCKPIAHGPPALRPSPDAEVPSGKERLARSLTTSDSAKYSSLGLQRNGASPFRRFFVLSPSTNRNDGDCMLGKCERQIYDENARSR